MKKEQTTIDGAWMIEPEVFEDHRGVFFESYSRPKFLELGIADDFVQDNHACSVAGVLRGLHFQYPPHAMSKLVRCTRGSLYDVIVDLRQESSTFQTWCGVELSEQNRRMLYVPTGCAHGFLALTDCELLYKCSAVYEKDSDGGVAYNDPTIGVAWPLNGRLPILSDRDLHQPSFAQVMNRARFV